MRICEAANRQDFVDVRESQHMDKSHAIRASSRWVGGDVICYTIRIGGASKLLYFEDPRWFVEEIVTDDIPA